MDRNKSACLGASPNVTTHTKTEILASSDNRLGKINSDQDRHAAKNTSHLDDGATATGLVLLNFWQASCAPCRALEPRLERFAAARAGHLTGYRIDVDTDTVIKYGVMSIPTVLLLRNGHEIARLDGLIRDHDLEDAVRAATS